MWPALMTESVVYMILDVVFISWLVRQSYSPRTMGTACVGGLETYMGVEAESPDLFVNDIFI
jgi:hypothetical protein